MLTKLWNSFSSRLWVWSRLFVALTLITFLTASCSSLGGAALSALAGSGPSANANVQAGKTNSQTIGSSTVDERELNVTVEPNSRADVLQDTSTTNNVNVPPWVLLIIVCLAAGGAIGWVDNITRLIRRK